ncbi:mannose-P-dolichol utilization defect 1 protein [Actinidia rufa]|uniref:Mannose-P-dolichol utilization defect 1 protein n=1 Tax=Actinidia rufa TaxID=165716 RepID=A0A7J0FBH8_9ERIC|nr:mannose-P-dolichol utilization defect 1 protein [Actinidia rufa]
MVDMKFLGMDFSCAFGSLSDGKLPDKDCLLPLISKLLGYCIVAASTTVKLPQILKILKHQSVRGLSVVAFELEVVGYTIALAYCLHKGLPFSAYGELAFLLIQEQKYRGTQLLNLFNELCGFNGESFHQPTGKSSDKRYPFLLLMMVTIVMGSVLGIVMNGTILSQIIVYQKPHGKKEKKLD